MIKLDNGTTIFLDTSNNVVVRNGNLDSVIYEERSLVLILPLFECKLEDLQREALKSGFSIENIIPFEEITAFLLTKMKSSYWIEKVFTFLIENNLTNSLPYNSLILIKNKIIDKTISQKGRELLRQTLRLSNEKDINTNNQNAT